MTTAINIFLRQAVPKNGLSFDVALQEPNRGTLEAMAEIEEIRKNPENYKGYSDVDEMMKDLLAGKI